MESNTVKWFIDDSKVLIRQTRKQIRHRYFEALTIPQRLNLSTTCQKVVNALELIIHNIKSHRYIPRGGGLKR